jgi:hypothetical protein
MTTLSTAFRRAEKERGATDPILIIAGIAITLILIVGGSFAVSGFIGNAKNLNAQGDLDRVATAEGAFMSENDRYGALAVGPDITTQNTELSNGSIGFTPSADTNVKVRTSDAGWAAVAGSSTGDVFLRTSESSTIHKHDAAGSGTRVPVESARNFSLNSGATSTSDFSFDTLGTAPNKRPFAVSNVAAAWSPSGSAYRMALGPRNGGVPALSNFAFNLQPTYQAAAAAGTPLEGQRVTVAMQLRTNAAGLSSAINVFDAAGGTVTVTKGGDGTSSANTTKTVYATFTLDAASVGPTSRFSLTLTASSTAAQNIELSAIDIYRGDYDASRTWFNGATAAAGDDSYSWAGTPNASASIKSTLQAVSSAPTGFVLPDGIVWSDVMTDIAEVKQ